MSPNDDRRSGQERRAPGSGSLPNDWLFQEFSSLRDLVTEQHSRIRSEMSNGFAGIRADMQTHEREDRAVERRVHDLEVREDTANKSITKRNLTASGVVAAIVGPATAYFFRKWFGG